MNTRNNLAKSTTWNGVNHPSMRQAALANDMLPSKMERYIKRGFTSDDDVIKSRIESGYHKPIIVDGVGYDSTSAASRATGFSHFALSSHSKDGAMQTEDIKKPDGMEWNGVWYESQSKGALALGISRQAMAQRLKNGYTCDADMNWIKGNM